MIDQGSVTDPPLMLDVDTGVDDALAIAFALRSGANLIGVSTVAGNVPIDQATQNTLQVLSWMDAEEVPVHRGASRPLALDYVHAAHVHGENGLGGAELDISGALESALGGVAAILANAERFAGELVLVALGPLTNVAIALSLRPRLTRQIRKLVVMGGAYFVKGNVTPDAEFNAFADPHACSQVLAANWNEIVAVGLDVTQQTVISSDQWEATQDDGTAATGLVRRVTRRTFTVLGRDRFYLHDPLAVAVALRPDLVRLERYSIEVNVADRRGKTVPLGGGGVSIAMSVDVRRFETLFSDTVGIPRGSQRTRAPRG